MRRDPGIPLPIQNTLVISYPRHRILGLSTESALVFFSNCSFSGVLLCFRALPWLAQSSYCIYCLHSRLWETICWWWSWPSHLACALKNATRHCHQGHLATLTVKMTNKPPCVDQKALQKSHCRRRAERNRQCLPDTAWTPAEIWFFLNNTLCKSLQAAMDIAPSLLTVVLLCKAAASSAPADSWLLTAILPNTSTGLGTTFFPLQTIWKNRYL